MLTAAVALLLIGFSQTAGDARAFAAKHRYQIDINQESVAQALANTGAGLFQGMPVSTSLSASSLNDHSGARSGLASIVSGVTVLLTLLFLAPLFSGLPKPVLAALIIEAVVMGMMDVAEMRRLAEVQRFDFWIAVTAIVATLLVGVLAGVVVGVVLSLLWLIAVTTRPHLPQLGRRPGTAGVPRLRGASRRRAGSRHRGAPGRQRALLRHRRRRRGPGPRAHPRAHGSHRVRPRLRRGQLIDSQGSAEVAAIARLTEEAGLELRLARVKTAVAAVLDRDGVLDLLGRDHLHSSVDEAVQAQQARR